LKSETKSRLATNS